MENASSSSTKLGTTLAKEVLKSGARKKNLQVSAATSNLQRSQTGRFLGFVDLVLLGVGGTVGAGVFLLTGIAAARDAGPSIVLSFALAAFVCALSAFSYAEMASRLPSCGSAYAFAYSTIGELFAFLVGWCLTLEYGISAAAVARSWAAHVSEAAQLPKFLHNSSGLSILGFILVIALTLILCSGMREAKWIIDSAAILYALVLSAILVRGLFLINPTNWIPFAPYGFSGVVAGASTVFFAFVGFDQVAAVAEEAHNPSQTVPKAILTCLLIVFTIYAAAALVLTGIVSYTTLDTQAPFIAAFKERGLAVFGRLAAIATALGMQNTAMVALAAQPRIFFAMARDGLLPELFGEVSGPGSAPRASSLLCGFGVAILALLVPLQTLTDLVSGGTILALLSTNVAVLYLRLQISGHEGDSKILLILFVSSCAVASWLSRVMPYRIVGVIITLSIVSFPFFLLMRMPFTDESNPPSFRSPGVPFVQACGIFFNLFLFFRLHTAALSMLAVWLVIGFTFYVAYGIRHSLGSAWERVDSVAFAQRQPHLTFNLRSSFDSLGEEASTSEWFQASDVTTE
ncbi:Cationic amino acid transporter 9, chloroplastic [Galdieria sulphuraria]|uniref:Amino acid permease, APC family n=1 Tax=Galdieria sulphuraria TaxID=130081 RepID=M2X0G8_GALSU|nr:amino acid permease, APC family [Galdieria sulphuraria]EME29825.1 amino acid permease, APC family [Galdieria sulphuraria]GJD06812.1 Cationic amino acid transporter 9, chloroplastic [Galdieria sulphuraria]|eukprot:XP_005706345.1 amino acid permease, APC family [Galdieria sulphuraria]